MNRPRIQHVSVPRPPGVATAETARQFYGGLLGLDEAPVPETIAHLDLVWFRLGDTELHVFSEEGSADGGGRHFCVEVDDVDATRQALSEAGYEPRDTFVIRGRPRFFCRDPFGNDIEFTTIVGDYLT